MDDEHDVLLELLFPEVCAGCGVLLRRGRRSFCRGCTAEIVALPPERASAHGIAALYAYEGPLMHALGRHKYGREPAWAGPLGRLLARAPDLWPDAGWELVVPVPLHPRRRFARGFNQSELLVRHALRQHRHPGRRDPLRARALRRVRSTPPQVELSAAERLASVSGAFDVPRSWRPRVRGRTVLVVDDVTTTGATLTACRAALLDAGAARVGALALLRTLA